MQIEQIDHRTVKIILSVEDMEQYALTYDQMDYNDRTTRRAILSIMEQVQSHTTLDVEQNKLFIEAFPGDGGGCVLYVNLVNVRDNGKTFQKERPSFDTPLIFQLDTVDILAASCKRLFYDYAHLIIKSSLYTGDRSGYVVLLYTYCRSNQRIINIMTEYGTYLGKGAVRAAHHKEHGRELITDNAIETILDCLC